MPNEILLTIALPVFNGAATIATLLKSIQLQQNQAVELILLDNNSIDDTLSIIDSFINNGLNLRYIKQIENVGPDQNFLDCVKEAKGKYVWLIGDDDYLEPYAINHVLNVIRDNSDCSAFITDFSLRSGAYTIKDKYMNISEDKKVTTVVELIQEVGLDFNFLSCVIHNREKFLGTKYRLYFNTYWLQVGTFLEYVKDEKVYLISDPVVVNAGSSIDGVANIEGNSIRVILNLCRMAQDFSKVYGDEFDSLTKNYLLKHVNRKIAIAKRSSYSFNYRDYKAFLDLFYSRLSFWFFTTPLYILPNSWHRLLYKLYLKLNMSKIIWKHF